MKQPHVSHFYDEPSGSMQYLVSCDRTGRCAIIDPVLDFDRVACATSTGWADEILREVEDRDLTVEWILDTHPHADHFSAAAYLKSRTGAAVATGARVVDVQALWRDIYNLPASFACDGSQWDHLFADGETFRLGDLDVEVVHSPGHTLSSITFLIGGAAFVHDTLFMPDGGTARADFPGGDAGALWESIRRILALPDETRLFTGHDYRPSGRPPLCVSTVREQRETNGHLLAAKSRSEFVQFREERDRELPLPDLMLHALQVNLNGAHLPDPETNGKAYLKLPLDVFRCRTGSDVHRVGTPNGHPPSGRSRSAGWTPEPHRRREP